MDKDAIYKKAFEMGRANADLSVVSATVHINDLSGEALMMFGKGLLDGARENWLTQLRETLDALPFENQRELMNELMSAVQKYADEIG